MMTEVTFHNDVTLIKWLILINFGGLYWAVSSIIQVHQRLLVLVCVTSLPRPWNVRRTWMNQLYFATVPKQCFSILLALLIICHTLTESGNSGKLCHMLSVALTIQRPYMAIPENLVTCFS